MTGLADRPIKCIDSTGHRLQQTDQCAVFRESGAGVLVDNGGGGERHRTKRNPIC
jgi:hypothetical protein